MTAAPPTPALTVTAEGNLFVYIWHFLLFYLETLVLVGFGLGFCLCIEMYWGLNASLGCQFPDPAAKFWKFC